MNCEECLGVGEVKCEIRYGDGGGWKIGIDYEGWEVCEFCDGVGFVRCPTCDV